MCKSGFWVVAMPCIEVLSVFKNYVTFTILKMYRSSSGSKGGFVKHGAA